MNSNCSLLIFLINSQRDVLSLAACVWTRLDCHAMGMGTGRERRREVSSQLQEGTQGWLLLAEPTALSFSATGGWAGP